MVRQLFENSAVRITSVIIAVAFLCGVVASEVAWKVNVSRDIRETRKDIAELRRQLDKKTMDRWHRVDMARWAAETERQNMELGWVAGDVTWP